MTVHESESEGPNGRGRPLGRWKNRVEEYLGERYERKQARREQGFRTMDR